MENENEKKKHWKSQKAIVKGLESAIEQYFVLVQKNLLRT